ncbi:hypothetical protein RA210_U480004 [Rubrivivax sp. A210]|nr:hypothetical protein RA210_U480004 [Rubrivivax sp. A210]
MVRGTFSPARAWRPAAGARLARTLGLATNVLGGPRAESIRRTKPIVRAELVGEQS